MPHGGAKVCELVLFMLMPERSCEDHHVDTLPVITILRSPHPRKTGTTLSNPSTAVAMTSSADSDPAVTRFLDAVWMERGLSPNTLAAYRADLTALARWLGHLGEPHATADNPTSTGEIVAISSAPAACATIDRSVIGGVRTFQGEKGRTLLQRVVTQFSNANDPDDMARTLTFS